MKTVDRQETDIPPDVKKMMEQHGKSIRNMWIAIDIIVLLIAVFAALKEWFV